AYPGTHRRRSGVIASTRSITSGQCPSSAARGSAATCSPDTCSRYALACSGVSAIPARRSTALPGAQIPPPERAVDPPNQAVFSSTTTDSPRRAAVSAAVIPAAPLPATITSNSAYSVLSVAMPPPGSILEHVTVLRSLEGDCVDAGWDIEAQVVVIGLGAAGACAALEAAAAGCQVLVLDRFTG